MKILENFAIFILIFFLGLLANMYLGIPAGIASLFFMFFALLAGLVKLEKIQSFAQFFLSISGFILLPFFVNGLVYKDLITPVFFSWFLVVTLGTLATLITTALVIQLIQKALLSRKNR